MAVGATRANPLLVDVIFPVACPAITGCCLEYSGEMALFARSYRMHSVQREAGHGMIETNLPTPAVCIMTCFALLSFLPLVDIIRRMTAVAVCSQVFSSQFATVT